MSKRIKCVWSESSPFSREVIAHFILKDNPEYRDIIDQKVDEWFLSFRGSSYEGDVMTTGKISNWFNSYFMDLGCNREHIIPYIKDFWMCFGDYGVFLFERYLERIGAKDGSEYLDGMPFLEFSRDYKIYANSVFKGMLPDGKDLYFDYKRGARIVENFDKEFDWLSKYEFNPKWKIAFCLPVNYISRCGCSDEEKAEKEVFDTAAENFLDKYLALEEMRDFLNQKICVDGKDTTMEEFFRHLFGGMGN